MYPSMVMVLTCVPFTRRLLSSTTAAPIAALVESARQAEIKYKLCTSIALKIVLNLA